MKMYMLLTVFIVGIAQAAKDGRSVSELNVSLPGETVLSTIVEEGGKRALVTSVNKHRIIFARLIDINTNRVISQTEYQQYNHSQILIPATIGAAVGTVATLAVTKKCTIL